MIKLYRRGPIIRLGMVVIAAVVFGAMGFHWIEGWNMLDSLYMSVMTLTTVGFGEVHPLGTHGRVFAILLMLLGIGVVTFSLATLIQLVVQSEILSAMDERRHTREINRLDGHFVICGAGRTGAQIVRDIEQTGEDFVVIEKDPEKIASLKDRNVRHIIQGDATTEETLKRAGVGHAKALVTCLTDDADNLYTVLVSRDLNPKLHIVARAVEEGAEPRLLRAGANRVIAPNIIGSKRLSVAMRKPAVDILLDSVSAGELDLQADHITIRPESELAGKHLQSSQVKSLLNVLVVSVQRPDGKTVFNPSGNFRFTAGDVLFAVGMGDSLTELRVLADGGEI